MSRSCVLYAAVEPAAAVGRASERYVNRRRHSVGNEIDKRPFRFIIRAESYGVRPPQEDIALELRADSKVCSVGVVRALRYGCRLLGGASELIPNIPFSASRSPRRRRCYPQRRRPLRLL